MSSQVVRVQGFTKGSLGGVGREAERYKVNHRNPDIDPEKTHLNMPFKQTDHGFYAAYQEIRKQLHVQGKETKTGIAFEGMVITAEAAFFKERFGWEPGKPMSPELVGYWRECYAWALQQVGYKGSDANVLSAVVHADETSLHLQMYYLPITDRWQEKIYAKDDQGKVLRNAKGSPVQAKGPDGKTLYRQVEDPDAPKLSRSEFWRLRGGQNSYARMQDSFHEQIGSRYGLERGEIGSNAEHRTKAQWEADQLAAKQAELQDAKNALQADIAALETKKEALTAAEVEAIKGSKTITGALKGVTYHEFEALKATAAKVESMERERDQAIQERDQAVQNIIAYSKKVEADANAQLFAKVSEIDSQMEAVRAEAAAKVDRAIAQKAGLEMAIEQLKRENRRLTSDVGRLKEVVAHLLGLIRDRVPELLETAQKRAQSILGRSAGRNRE